MKTIKAVLPKMLGFFLVMVIITGVIYPLVITGLSRVFFNKQATGSIIEIDGVKYGSGLDPEISPAAAGYQAERIAGVRGITVEEVEAVIHEYTRGRALGIFGEPGVNV